MNTVNNYRGIYLGYPCFKLGQEKAICKNLGWEGKYSEANTTLLDLAVNAGLATLRASDLPISRILLCTESHWNYRELDAEKIAALKIELNLPNAHITSLGLNYCNNFHNVIDVASAILEKDGGNVLIILTDICEPSESRTVGDSIGVLSDGASSFILTKEKPTGGMFYEVVTYSLISDSSLGIAAGAESHDAVKAGDIGRLVNIIESLKQSVYNYVDNYGFDYLITCNFRPDLIELYATLLGCVTGAYNSILSVRYSHVFSSDVVISLAHILEQSTSEQTVLAFTNGPHSWGMSLLKRI